MAMVNLSERNHSYIPSNGDQSLSFGNESIISKPISSREPIMRKASSKDKHPPFNSICPRPEPGNRSIVPGPGAYENLITIKPKPPVSNDEDLQFLSKEPRFKSLESEEELPGPGAYDILNRKRVICLNRNMKPLSASVKYNTNSLSNITTIPSKDHIYGYKYSSDGSLIMVEDPEKGEGYSGHKNDSVGPGQYDPQIKKDNNHILNWDKMSSRKLSSLTRSTEEKTIIEELMPKEQKEKFRGIDSARLNSIEYNNEKIVERKKAILNKKKMIQQLMNHRHKLFQTHNTIEQYFGSENKSDYNPSPEIEELFTGKKMEYPMNFNKLRYQGKPTRFQFFGSSSQKSPSYIKVDTDIKVGPGSYFIKPQKSPVKLHKSKSAVIEKLLLSKSKPISLNNNTDNIGPGSYNIQENYIKKSFSNCQNFGSFQRRFVEPTKHPEYLPPGPGSYALPDNWAGNKIKYECRPHYTFAKRPQSQIVNDKKQPTFNSYQPPQVLNKIEHDVQLKVNQRNNALAPFCSMEKRFNSLYRSNSVGPGQYFNDILNPPKSASYLSFDKTSAKRSVAALCERDKTNIGPGEYQKDSYFDWNKKSYNIMFI